MSRVLIRLLLVTVQSFGTAQTENPSPPQHSYEDRTGDVGRSTSLSIKYSLGNAITACKQSGKVLPVSYPACISLPARMMGIHSSLSLKAKFLCMDNAWQTALQWSHPAFKAGSSLFCTSATFCADAKEQCKSDTNEGGLLLHKPLTAPHWQV